MSKHTTAYEEKMKKSVKNLESELNTIRAGRANPHVLDKITVDYYGTPTPLNQVGNISIPEARLIQIQPWDISVMKEIEKAINASDLGINPTNDGKVIRLVFPELTEERRKALTKDVKKKGEDTKVAIRNIRRDGIDAFKKLEKANEITEDELKSLEDEIQKITDKNVADIDKLIEAKNKDIMAI
ncbi:MAG: ribosome recycling factor [Clostridiales bacterium]|jgi:ribosome recycling factor|nr:ribosome recycling factor [Clostridiales bacterium]